jgi:type IV fimbrial biogenesis protein FimT
MVTAMRALPRGFTLIELMMTLAVLAVLTTLAAPSFRSLIASQNVKAAASSLQSSLLFARSEALKRNRSVALAPRESGNWARGWTVQCADCGDVRDLLGTSPIPDAGVQIAASADSVVYQASGRVQDSEACFVVFSADQATPQQRYVLIDLTGIPRVSADKPSPNC